MSFRLFVYYCALGGAWAGFVGWLLGRILAPTVAPGNVDYFPAVLRDSIIGMLLGFAVTSGLSFLDAAFNLSLRQFSRIIVRVFAAVVVGIFGGLLGGFVGGSLYFLMKSYLVLALISFVFGWTIVGFLIGISIAFFEVASSLLRQRDFVSSFKKFLKCLVGGTLGGIIGGIIAATLQFLAQILTARDDVRYLWSPTALGFIAIGACIGLLVGLAQVMLKEAWIKVEAGFRPGREMILSKERTTIGRAEGSDIALFGDSGVEKAHANIVLEGGRYYLEDLQSPGGSYVNDQKVSGRTPLKAGDLIRVGKSILRFNERAKRKD